MKWWLCLFLILVSGPGRAQDFDYRAFGEMPVLESGRLKPLDSLARVMMKRIRGETFAGGLASGWLAGLFFAPEEAMRAPTFSVTSQAARILGLPPQPDRAYSFEELAGTLSKHAAFLQSLAQKDKSGLSREEAEVMRLYGATNDFAELVGTFSLLLPMNNADELRAILHLPPDAKMTFFDLQKKRQAIMDELGAVVKRKGARLAAYTPGELALAQVAERLSTLETLDRDNALVRVIPPDWGGQEWLSPWGVFRESSGSPESAALLKTWRDAASAYRAQDAAAWNKATRILLARSMAAVTPLESWQLELEYLYHRLSLLAFAGLFYGGGIAAMGLGLKGRFRLGMRFAKASLLFGLMLHATALMMRMLILMRPPVSTLYESLIFVSFVVMAASNWLGWARRNYAGLLVGALTSLLLLGASRVFAGDGDTLGVLVAVLNTNFWLATHVVCITTGYATSLVTGAMGHLYLLRRSWRGESEEALRPLAKLLHRAALAALLFTAVGTMLGGIWADQSWGRFWGWDPKENGALLIVLWLIWLLHGRIAGQLGAYGFAAWAALINVVVALAWIGVNLLGVGLHSYGFTDAAANGLAGFCIAEFGFVGLTAMRQRLAGRRLTAPSPAG